MPILRHIHLPGLTRYSHASHLQSILVAEFLTHKAALSKSLLLTTQTNSSPSPSPSPLPTATILTFQPYPIYTTGRRETRTNPPAPSLLEYLTKTPLVSKDYGVQTAEYEHALRGGQITFHGPGQLVIYPILSLSHPESFPLPSSTLHAGASSIAPVGKPRLTPRTYISMLERTTIATLQQYGIPSTTSAVNPGVWLTRDEDVKIAALGVHLRRNVTSHGVGLNVTTDLRWFERIVGCGLEGKGAGSMEVERERARTGLAGVGGQAGGVEVMLDVDNIGRTWVNEFARDLELGEADVTQATEKDILD